MVCSCPFAGGAREQQHIHLATEGKIAARTASFALFVAGETLMIVEVSATELAVNWGNVDCWRDEQGSRQ